MSRVFTRCITLEGTTINSNLKNLFPALDNKSTQFEVLNQPLFLVRATVPPEIPFYVRKGLLVSLYNSSKISTISMSHQRFQPWTKFLRYGSLRTSLYNKLVSDKQMHCLIAPSSSVGRIGALLRFRVLCYRTLCPLWLDGTSDWFVFGKNSLVAFEMNSSLNICEAPLAFFTLGRSPSFGYNYQIFRGRGSVLLSGTGTIHKVELKDVNDEIIIRADNLLAINGVNHIDIKSSVSKFMTDVCEEYVLHYRPPSLRTDFTWSNGFFNIKHYLKIMWNKLCLLYFFLLNGSTNHYLKVTGPRTLLIQSSSNSALPVSSLKDSTAFKGNTAVKAIDTSMQPHVASADAKNYLNYAYVNNNRDISFQSTSDFCETVAKIENLEQKQ